MNVDKHAETTNITYSQKFTIFEGKCLLVLCPGANIWRFKNINLTDSFWKVFCFMSWRCRNSISGIGFLSVGFPSKKWSEQTNTCLGMDFLFKAFAHCNRIDSSEGIVCSLYGISLHVFVYVIHKKFVSIHLIYGDYLNNRWWHTNYHTNNINTRNNTKNRCENKRQLMFTNDIL